MASGVYFSIAPRLLGTVRFVFSGRASAMGWSLSDRSVIDASGCGNGALHHGPVSESAESGGIRGNLHARANLGKEICKGFVLAGVRCLHAPFHGGVSIFFLSLVRVYGEV